MERGIKTMIGRRWEGWRERDKERGMERETERRIGRRKRGMEREERDGEVQKVGEKERHGGIEGWRGGNSERDRERC